MALKRRCTIFAFHLFLHCFLRDLSRNSDSTGLQAGVLRHSQRRAQKEGQDEPHGCGESAA
jgi:hypothetical protein